MAKDNKTNVCRILDSKKIDYILHTYDGEGLSGREIAQRLGEPLDMVFKTLVTVSKSKAYYVFDIPVDAELDLKKAAKAVSEKSIEMIPQKELLPLTGYIHGGCSMIGMKKFFKTVIDISAKEHSKIMFSAGKVGFQVEMKLEDLEKVIRVEYADLVV